MKKLFYLSILLIGISACNNSIEKEIKMPENSEKLSFLALGDSYTIGESVSPKLRWPVQLVDSLKSHGIALKDPKIIAITGWTTQDLLNAMDNQLENEKFDLVSVSIGVNNQYQGKSIKDYENDLHTIFKKAIFHSKFGIKGVFAVSIPDYGATPFGAAKSKEIEKEIAQFNEVFEKVASEFNIEFYKITPISKRASEEKDLVADDGLHPSGKMYSLWVEEFLPEIIQKISSLRIQ
ncbi:MAG TPA: SGNH/GDSL hydrolase family protein [Salinimicrobium sp.]|nr:SGNH/GDSL hydrolase family protein [Salinimicrobium sp.]